jgi:hypothetical protein
MGLTSRPRLGRRLTVVTVAGLLATTGSLLSATAASASTGNSITVQYKVSGSTLIKSVNATANLGPGTLTSTVNLKTGALSASLALPAATVSYKEIGLVPVQATTEFIQDGKTTGKLNPNTGAVSTSSKITLKVTAIKVAGISLPVPANCESATPAVVNLKSEKGFNVVKGGKVGGTYAIPDFSGCGLLTPVLNATIPGSGNTIALKLGAAKVV